MLRQLPNTVQSLVVAATDRGEARDIAVRTVQADVPKAYRRCKVSAMAPIADGRYDVSVSVQTFVRA